MPSLCAGTDDAGARSYQAEWRQLAEASSQESFSLTTIGKSPRLP